MTGKGRVVIFRRNSLACCAKNCSLMIAAAQTEGYIHISTATSVKLSSPQYTRGRHITTWTTCQRVRPGPPGNSQSLVLRKLSLAKM